MTVRIEKPSRRRTARVVAAAVIGGGLMTLSTTAHAQFTFNNVVDSTSIAGVTAFNLARINDNGTVAYHTGSGATQAYYLSSGGTNTRVVGAGDTVSVLNTSNVAVNATISTLDTLYFTLDNSNRLTFLPTLTQTTGITNTNNGGIFRYSNGTISTIVQKGTTVINGTTIGSIGSFNANNAGDIAFQTSSPTWAIYKSAANGTNSLVIQEGTPAPGLSSGTVDTFSFPDIDDSGNISYLGVVGGNPIANRVIGNVSAGGTSTKTAANGDTAPGVSNGIFTFFGRGWRNEAGQSAFIAGGSPLVNGTLGNQLRGIWQGTGSAISLVALQGQNAPGGGIFGSGYTLGNINSSGTGVFLATGMTGGSTSASFVFNGATVERLLGLGDGLFGSTVTDIGMPMINNNGLVVLNYTLANGRQGVLTAGRVGGSAAPEPGSLFLASSGLLLTGILRRRRQRG